MGKKLPQNNNYLVPLDRVILAVVREYGKADETRKAELRLRNPDLDLDDLLKKLEAKVQ